jgi:hypothetical protein
LSAEDVSITTDVPVAIVEEMLECVASQAVGWLAVTDSRIPQGYHADTSGISKSVLHGEGNGSGKGDGKGEGECLEDEFERVWALYPLKTEKAKSRKHYIAARRSGVTRETIEDGIRRYIAHVAWQKRNGFRDLKYRGGAVWFGNACWEDEYTVDEPQEEETPEGCF